MIKVCITITISLSWNIFIRAKGRGRWEGGLGLALALFNSHRSKLCTGIFSPKGVIRGLWSVSNSKFLPIKFKYCWNFLMPYMILRWTDSRSIWEEFGSELSSVLYVKTKKQKSFIEHLHKQKRKQIIVYLAVVSKTMVVRTWSLLFGGHTWNIAVIKYIYFHTFHSKAKPKYWAWFF